MASATGDRAFVRRFDGTIIQWDQKAHDLYGWDREEAVGKISHILLETKFPYELDAINKTLLREGYWEGNLIHTTNGGARLEVASSWSLRRDESGKPVEILEVNSPVRTHLRPVSEILVNGLHWFPLVVVTVLPVLMTANLWRELWQGVRVRAWDGTGHYAFGEIYSKTIFPDTFGWTHAFFNGMPFPNFYPPLFHWCVALLHNTGLFSFATSFKIMIALPTLLIPVVTWLLAWKVSNRDRTVATAAGLAVLPLLVHWRFQVPFGGLDYFNTFHVGLYTQPLGFVLLATWFVSYLDGHKNRWRFALASLLLALTVLASFFSAVTAAFFILVTVAFDFAKYFSSGAHERVEVRRVLTMRLASPVVALGLTLFWVVPMIAAYDYFASFPVSWYVVPRAMWVWYGLAFIGMACWLRARTDAMLVFVTTCIASALLVVGGAVISPRWFPLQAFRFLPILNFLMAVPVGYLFATLLKLVLDSIERIRLPRTPFVEKMLAALRVYRPTVPSFLLAILGVVGVLSSMSVITLASYNLAFYPPNAEPAESILNFAKKNTEGRYLVEPILYKPVAENTPDAFDSEALAQFLGVAEGGAFTGLYAEASPHRVFFSTQRKAFSPTLRKDSGMRTGLTENPLFYRQPLSTHVERVRLLGVRYLVIHSIEMKEQLAQTEGVGARHDFGPWSVFELEVEPAPVARPLPYLPALVISDFSFKERHAAQYDFVRLSEEQFADGWFDVLLTLGQEKRIDRLQGLDQFGALILDTYEYVDGNKAFALLRNFAQRRPLILLESDSQVFKQIRGSLDQFPKAHIIGRKTGVEPRRTDATAFATDPTSLAIRKDWQQIRTILDADKVPVPNSSSTNFAVELSPERISIEPSELLSAVSVPVLINVTYHPNWRRTDGMREIYAATPFLMMTFLNEPTSLVYARRGLESLALAASGLTLIGLVGYVALGYRRRLRRGHLK